MKSSDLAEVRKTLWTAADHRFEQVRPELEAKATTRNPVTPDRYKDRSALFVPEKARLSYLVQLLPEAENRDAAQRAAEAYEATLGKKSPYRLWELTPSRDAQRAWTD